jgi:hypothetical protein
MLNGKLQFDHRFDESGSAVKDGEPFYSDQFFHRHFLPMLSPYRSLHRFHLNSPFHDMLHHDAGREWPIQDVALQQHKKT